MNLYVEKIFVKFTENLVHTFMERLLCKFDKVQSTDFFHFSPIFQYNLLNSNFVDFTIR